MFRVFVFLFFVESLNQNTICLHFYNVGIGAKGGRGSRSTLLLCWLACLVIKAARRFESAPSITSRRLPPRYRWNVGKALMPACMASSWHLSPSTCALLPLLVAMAQRAHKAHAACEVVYCTLTKSTWDHMRLLWSMTGAMALQGPHQVANQSTTITRCDPACFNKLAQSSSELTCTTSDRWAPLPRAAVW